MKLIAHNKLKLSVFESKMYHFDLADPEFRLRLEKIILWLLGRVNGGVAVRVKILDNSNRVMNSIDTKNLKWYRDNPGKV